MAWSPDAPGAKSGPGHKEHRGESWLAKKVPAIFQIVIFPRACPMLGSTILQKICCMDAFSSLQLQMKKALMHSL